MVEPIVDASQYIRLLEDFLLQLREDLDRKGKTVTVINDQLALDQYWLDINCFYYESFHNHFMPRYVQSIENDIRQLLNLNLQDSALKNNLLTILKLYVRSFNQTKFTLRQLQEQRQAIETHQSALQTGNDIRNVDLLYLLKEHVEAWALFSNQAEIACNLTAEDSLKNIFSNYPACTMAANLIQSWSPKDSKERRMLSRLLADWQLGLKVLQKLQENFLPGKDIIGIQIQQLEEIDSNWDNRKVIPAIRSWYQSNVQQDYRLYLDVLKLAGGKSDSKRGQRYAGQFHDWLQAWLNTLEQCIQWESRGWDQWVRALNHLQFLDPQICRELADYGQKGLKSINALIDGLSSSTDANYRYHSERCRHVLTEAYQYIEPKLADLDNSRPDPLSTSIRYFKWQVDLSLNQIDLIDDRESNAEQARKGFSILLSSIDANIGQLEPTLEQMAKLITSPGMKVIFEEMGLSIEQLSIEKGAILPTACRPLVEKGLIETKEEVAAAGTILHTEGDIFRIYLGELQYEEVPRIIIARKG